jgi:Polyketide cyclase / dehydrase and lipid transport
MAIGPFRSERRGSRELDGLGRSRRGSGREPARDPRHDPRRVERRVFVNAPPRIVWSTLVDPANAAALFPELRLGPADPAWPAAAAMRPARARLGLLRDDALLESLEARPLTTFRLSVAGRSFISEWRWRLEPRAGGTRIVHDAVLVPSDRITDWLIRLGRDSVSERVEAHLLALKEVAEAATRQDADVERRSRLA